MVPAQLLGKVSIQLQAPVDMNEGQSGTCPDLAFNPERVTGIEPAPSAWEPYRLTLGSRRFAD